MDVNVSSHARRARARWGWIGVLVALVVALAATAGAPRLAVAAASKPAPALTLTPTAGAAQTTVTASGTGFKKKSRVEIVFDATTVATVTTNTTGTFAGVTFSVPNVTPGAHTVTAKERNGRGRATATFTVLTPASLTIAPASNDLGTVVVGGSSAPQTFTVTNSGQAPSGPVTVQLAGANSSDFAVTSTTCAASLPAAGTCTVSARFAPTTSGPRTATLSATASPGGTATAALQGTATPALQGGNGLTPAALSISPPAAYLGQVGYTSSSQPQTLTVTNTGDVPSGPVTVAVIGEDTYQFVIDSTTCAARLAGGASCTVAVHFEPNYPGTSYATLTASADPGGTATAGLSGDGVSPANIDIDPPTADYGPVVVGATSVQRSYTIINRGGLASGPLTVQIAGDHAGDYVVTSNSCASSLGGSQSCTVSITFAPSALGPRAARLTVSGDPDDTITASMSGTGVAALTASPTSRTFAPRYPATGPSAPQDFVFTNYGPTALGSISVTSTDAADFPVVTDTCSGSSLQTGASCTISVAFGPTSNGDKTSTLTVQALDGSGQPASAAVTATGTGYSSPGDVAVAMDVVAQSSTQGTARITITNWGTAASAAGTVIIDVSPTQSFDYSAGAGSDCTSQFVPHSSAVQFTCAVPTIAPGATTTRDVVVDNLSYQNPKYVQVSATLSVPGDSTSWNNSAGRTLILN